MPKQCVMKSLTAFTKKIKACKEVHLKGELQMLKFHPPELESVTSAQWQPRFRAGVRDQI